MLLVMRFRWSIKMFVRYFQNPPLVLHLIHESKSLTLNQFLLYVQYACENMILLSYLIRYKTGSNAFCIDTIGSSRTPSPSPGLPNVLSIFALRVHYEIAHHRDHLLQLKTFQIIRYKKISAVVSFAFLCIKAFSLLQVFVLCMIQDKI